jgi:hypothetical protein
MNRVLSVLKTVYETFGAPHPKSSLIEVTVLGALLGAIVFFSAWRLRENEYRKESLGRVALPLNDFEAAGAPILRVVQGWGF